MTDKAYIVANEQQEREVLEKLEREGYVWIAGGEKPMRWRPEKDDYIFDGFPYALTVNRCVGWVSLSQLSDEEIVFDGRKEEHMSEKYVVSQEFMNELIEWKADIRHEWLKKDDGKWLNSADISDLEDITEDWWLDTEISYKESNNRLITIIRWVNGEDVFEVEKPKKWVVQDKEPRVGKSHHYGKLSWFDENLELGLFTYDRKEAESWANAHQEVVEVEE